MTTSSSSARRRYLDKSFFTSVKGTFFMQLSCPLKPCIRLSLGDDGQHLYSGFRYVIENADVTDAKPELRFRQPAQSLDAAFAGPGRLVAQILFERVANRSAQRRFQPAKVVEGFR